MRSSAGASPETTAPAVPGREAGATTSGRRGLRRDRRTGWYDAPITRYATRVNGITDLVLTKLDVLTGLEQIPVCVAYDVDGTRFGESRVEVAGCLFADHAGKAYNARLCRAEVRASLFRGNRYGVFLFDAFVLRHGWCGHLCPLGAFWSLAGRGAQVRIAFDDASCTRCGDCLKACPEPRVLNFNEAARHGFVKPGECTNCAACIAVCPESSLRLTLRPSKGVTP